MILVADSGGTKTSWILLEEGQAREQIQTQGINPIRDKKEDIHLVIKDLSNFIINALSLTPEKDINAIYFYGSGCIPPYTSTIADVLQQEFPAAHVMVESDMLGAAIALCGHNEGIACILGTGANSCLFDGTKIIKQTPALGFILGDEGSGACLGKRLIGDVLKNQLPKYIQEAFLEETKLTQAEIIDRVYRQAQPNKFLASLVPFLQKHQEEPEIDQLITDEFVRFLHRNIRNYNRPDLPVNFVGGLTQGFSCQLEKAIKHEGMLMGRTLQHPIEEMAKYFL